MYTKQDQLQKVKIKRVVIKSLPQLKATVQKAVNKYAKLRDLKNGCISCVKGESEQGGHYINQGSCSFLRYNLDNINGQCVTCNHFKSGNLIQYRINLVKKIGEKRVKYLEEHMKDTKKWKRDELEEKLKEIKQKTKELEK